MGITGAHELSHSVRGLTLQDVYKICTFIRQQRNDNDRPTIDLDVSLIYRSSKLSIDNRKRQFIDICCQLAAVGFAVVIICDGSVRHHSKRATVQRQASLFGEKVKSYLLRVRLMSIMVLKSSATDTVEKERLESEENSVSSQLKTLEKKLQYSNVDVGQEFYESLLHHVYNIPKANLGKKGGTIEIFQAEYQADSVLAFRRVNNISDIVFSSDSDLLAHAGSMCLGIKCFNYISRGKNTGMDQIELFVADDVMLSNITTALRMEPDNKDVKKSRNAIFDGIRCPKTRALLAVGLGCDVLKSGIRGISKVVLKEWLDLHKSDYNDCVMLHNKLVDFYCDRYSCDNTRTKKMIHSNIMNENDRLSFTKSLNVLIDAFMYEPCNYINGSDPTDGDNGDPVFIHNNNPESLHIYLRDFAKGNTNIKIHGDNSDICTCIGVGKGAHVFLSFEGTATCHRCTSSCCRYCCFEIKDNANNISKTYCYECYLSEKVIPVSEIDKHVPIECMVTKLQQAGIEVQRDEELDVVLALYDHNITKKELIFDEETLNSCPMPFEDSNYLTKQHVIFNFSFEEGGQILRHNKLDVDNKVQLISLIAKLVTVKPDAKNRNHSAVPELLVDCAKGARLRGGDRLLARALRHSVDDDQSTIYDAKASLIKYKGMLGINIITKVRASMKNTFYDVTVSFCEKGIISNACTCKVGCLGIERVMCIHILPVIQLLSVEAYTGLATDYLYNMNQEWDTDMEKAVPIHDIPKLHSNILLLIRGSNLHTPKQYNEKETITELLAKYDTGTDKRKVGPGMPLNKKRLGPLREVRFISPYLQTMNGKKKKKLPPVHFSDDDEPVRLPYTPLPPKENIPYGDILNKIKYIRESLNDTDDSTFEDCIGYRLLGTRASKGNNLLQVLDIGTKGKINELLHVGRMAVRLPNYRDRKARLNNISTTSRTSNVVPDEDHLTTDSDTSTVFSSDDDATDDEQHATDEDATEVEVDGTGKEEPQRNNESNDGTDDDGTGKEEPRRNNESNGGTEDDGTSSEESTCTENGTGTEQSTVVTRYKQYQKCCVPGCQPYYYDACFRRLPACPAKKLATASDKVRKTYAIKQYKRKEWIRRLGLNANNCPSHLLYCNKHVMEKTLVSISWRRKNGKNTRIQQWMELPRDPDKGDIQTRNDKRKRKLLPERTPSPARKKQTLVIYKKKDHERYPAHRCCYVNCNYHSLSPDTFFTRVPAVPKCFVTETSKDEIRINYAKKLYYRAEFLRRIGSPNDERLGIRICNHHSVEKITKQLTYSAENGKIRSTSVTLNVPSACTIKSNLNTNSATKNRRNKGSAYNRFQDNYVQEAMDCSQTMEGQDWAYSLFQTVNHYEQSAQGTSTDTNDNKFRKPIYGIVRRARKEPRPRAKTVVQIDNYPVSVLTATTGFRSMSSMISYIVLVCNGDPDLVRKTSSSMTWLEEWNYFFERLYGRSLPRMVDCKIKYGLGEAILRKVYGKKLALVKAARARWPMYATFEEDELLRDRKWDSTYLGKRIIMWDNTDIPLPKPSHPNLQRNTFSEYYSGNVGKGSVFIQLCGWMGTHELWEGAITDSDYFRRSGILPLQVAYVDLYDPDHFDKKWINVLDRGYKVVGDCFAHGEQKCLQPSFSRPGGAKFSGKDTQLTAAVAADRGANERAVKIAKISKFVSNGYRHTVTVTQLCDSWLAWGFQANFVYKPVL